MIALGLPVGFGLALLLIWFFFRKGGYKRRPLDAPPGPTGNLPASGSSIRRRARRWKSGLAQGPANAPMCEGGGAKDVGGAAAVT
jgi:hypothetical protein